MRLIGRKSEQLSAFSIQHSALNFGFAITSLKIIG
jgi:hypothetical protein